MRTTVTVGRDNHGLFVCTSWPDGAALIARPDGSPEQAATAAELGYVDVEAMTEEHDPTHTALCQWLGLDGSPTLRAAATDELQPWFWHIEEKAVLALQELRNALRSEGLL